jgi:SET family sugar efflux transporter-like MFS transporter
LTGNIVAQLRRFLRVPGSWQLLSVMAVYGAGIGILQPMNAIYLKDSLHLSKLLISLLISITTVANMGVTFTSGLLSDRIRRRKSLPVIAALCCVAGLAGYDRAAGFGSALFFYILAVTPSGIIFGQFYAMARSHLTRESPDIVEIGIVWLRTLFSFGFFIGLLLGAALFPVVSFHGVILGNLVCYAILFFLFLSYREREGTGIVAPRPAGVPLEWLLLLAFLLMLCCDAIRGLYFPLMVDALYKNPVLVSRLWSVQVIFEFVWMTVGGVAAQRFGAVRVTAWAGLASLAVYLLYATSPLLPWLFAAQPVYSFFVSVENTVVMGLVQRMFLHRAGFGSSLYFVLSQTASLVGYLIPNVIPGFSPHIFYLTAALMTVSLGLIFYKLRRGGTSL